MGADQDTLRPVPRDPADGGPGPGPEDQLAWLLAAEDDANFVGRVFEGFAERLDELGGRIAAGLADGRLDVRRRRAVYERIAVSVRRLLELADAVEADRGR
jgi:hypothetical protein